MTEIRILTQYLRVIEDVRSISNERHKVTSSIYISYNLLLEGLEHESISRSHVLDWKYNAPYPFYLIPVNLVELVLGGQVSSSTNSSLICNNMYILVIHGEIRALNF